MVGFKPSLSAADHERAEIAVTGRADSLHRIVVGLVGGPAFIGIGRCRGGIDIHRVCLAALRATIDPIVHRAGNRLPRDRPAASHSRDERYFLAAGPAISSS